MMKQLPLSMIALVILFCGTAAAAYQSPDEIDVSILRYEPSPAEPGNMVDLWLVLANKGGDLQDVRLKAVPEFPFTIAPQQVKEVSVGNIPAGEDAQVKYRLLTDLSAPYGEENVTFYYTFGKALSWRKYDYALSVQPRDVSVTIDRYTVTPSIIRPGEKATLRIQLQNNGRLAVQSIDVTLEMGTDSGFAIFGSGNTKRIFGIPAGGSATVNFSVITDTTADIKLHSFPVNLKFRDERGQEHEQSSHIAFLVSADPEISVAIDKSEVTQEKRMGEVSFKIVNRGIVDVKYLTATLAPSDDYVLLSPSNEAYVGNLDSDDFESVDFKVRVTADKPVFVLHLKFKDQYNTDFRQSHNLLLRLFSAKELGKNTTIWPIILALLFLAGGGCWWWRTRQRNRKHKR